jgi:hypothetical protein
VRGCVPVCSPRPCVRVCVLWLREARKILLTIAATHSSLPYARMCASVCAPATQTDEGMLYEDEDVDFMRDPREVIIHTEVGFG